MTSTGSHKRDDEIDADDGSTCSGVDWCCEHSYVFCVSNAIVSFRRMLRNAACGRWCRRNIRKTTELQAAFIRTIPFERQLI
mmetsp:Transcript_26374/g.26825  ORF Transcript_26374/g.26825 Transcript_26374/m.26825 type:complete len:82 (+) Transcript_26374:237-482(+)